MTRAKMHLMIAASLLSCGLATGVFAAEKAKFATPGRGSADRTQLLDLMRKPMESIFGKPIEFDVIIMSVSGSNGFARLHPHKPGGAPLVIDFPCEADGSDIEIEATFVKKHDVWAFDEPADGQPGFCADDAFDWDTWLRKRGLPPQFVGQEMFMDGSN